MYLSKFKYIVKFLFYKIKYYFSSLGLDSTIHTNNKDVNIKEQLKSLGEFYFLPNKGNLGDCVIACAEYQYFDANSISYKVLDIDNKNLLDEEFNFVYGGGGIWHNLYKENYQEILNIFKSPKLKKCVILPSSFNDCDDAIAVMDERFTVFCREEQAFKYCKSINNKATFILANDMVVDMDLNVFKSKYLNAQNSKRFFSSNLKIYKIIYKKIYNYYFQIFQKSQNDLAKLENSDTYNIAYFLRSDKESNDVIDLPSVDPSNWGGGFCCDRALTFMLASVFINSINKYDTIVTDRLHIGICATKLEKNVLLLDNSYKKNSSVYEYSLKNYKNVRLVDKEFIKCYKNEEIDIEKNNLLQPPSTLEGFIYQYANLYSEFGYEKRFW